MRNGNDKQLNITDDIGNIDDIILMEEIRLLLPHADNLLAPILKKKLTKMSSRSKLRVAIPPHNLNSPQNKGIMS